MDRFRSGRPIVGVAAWLLAGCGGGGDARATTDSAPATAAPATAATLPAPAGRPAIVFLGTSLTAGYGLDPDSAYPALLQRKLDSAGLDFEVVNAGVSGQTSAGTLRQLDWILRSPPAYLVIETGANDMLRGQDTDSLRANLQVMIDRVKARAPATQVLLCAMEAMPNLGQRYVREFRAVYTGLAQANGLPLLPFLLDRVAGIDSLNQGDGIHPNEAGSRLVADNLWRALAPLLRARPASGPPD